MRVYELVVATLVVWRATHLLQAEDGPWDIFLRLRRTVEAKLGGRLLGCFDCLSLWLAAPLAAWLGADAAERLLLWPALSAGATLLTRATERTLLTPPAVYTEEPEDVLRKEPGDRPRDAS